MENRHITRFKKDITNLVELQKKQLVEETQKYLEAFREIVLGIFTSENPYTGNTSNKIFFTYSDHYRANSGMSMQVGKLHHPHTSMYDRGYIKGVVTDLDGYMKLRSAKNMRHNFDTVHRTYIPRFRKSVNSGTYEFLCNIVITKAKNDLDLFLKQQIDTLNFALKEMTGCSLLHYIQNI